MGEYLRFRRLFDEDAESILKIRPSKIQIVCIVLLPSSVSFFSINLSIVMFLGLITMLLFDLNNRLTEVAIRLHRSNLLQLDHADSDEHPQWMLDELEKRERAAAVD